MLEFVCLLPNVPDTVQFSKTLNKLFYPYFQVKARDQGNPPRSSTARLDIMWVALPPSSDEPVMFDELHFAFAVMETDPVTHMVGIIVMTETRRQKWFEITGEGKQTHTHAHTRSAVESSIDLKLFQFHLRKRE